MAEVKLVPAVCPRCGADLKLPEDLTKAHCVYCGAEFLVSGAPERKRVQCGVCKGAGKLEVCYSCHGSGRCTWSFSAQTQGGLSGPVLTSHCSSGHCSACGGTGRILFSRCMACGGTGHCPECRGSGRCKVCAGISMLPNPTGSIRCRTCGGDGFVDASEAEAKTPEKCPSCNTPWAVDGVFCSKCGHPKTCPRCGIHWEANANFCNHCGYRKGVRR
ncbi:MAG TPA: zinc ribbon domain-containing protein [Thermoplasmata archaeon]